MDKFEFGKCLYCKQDKALKNGVCAECEKEIDMPEFMKDLFGGFDGGEQKKP